MSETETMTEQLTVHPRPRIRWGAIAWGLIAGGIAATILYILGDAGRSEGFSTWLITLSGGAIVLILVLAAGALTLLLGLLAVIRRAQRSAASTDRLTQL